MTKQKQSAFKKYITVTRCVLILFIILGIYLESGGVLTKIFDTIKAESELLAEYGFGNIFEFQLSFVLNIIAGVTFFTGIAYLSYDSLKEPKSRILKACRSLLVFFSKSGLSIAQFLAAIAAGGMFYWIFKFTLSWTYLEFPLVLLLLIVIFELAKICFNPFNNYHFKNDKIKKFEQMCIQKNEITAFILFFISVIIFVFQFEFFICGLIKKAELIHNLYNRIENKSEVLDLFNFIF
jgi:hypothetical protein